MGGQGYGPLTAWILVLVVIGAGLFRLRGSSSWEAWTGRGVGSARWLWAAFLGVSAWLVDNGSAGAWAWGFPVPVVLPALIVALWAGSIGAWWGSLDMGTRDHTLSRDLLMHSLRGVVWTAFAAALVASLDLASPWPLLAAGALCGPIYAASWRLWPGYAVQGGEWGFGAAVAAALLFSVAYE